MARYPAKPFQALREKPEFKGYNQSVPTENEVLDALRAIEDPDLHKDIVSLGFVKNINVDNSRVSLEINLTTPACPVRDQFEVRAKELIGQLPGVTQVNVKMTADVRRTTTTDKSGMKGVKNIIAVGSGKGGVGKSTVAVNLACGMARVGAKVGLLDADIYGPTVPLMMGKGAAIEVGPDQKIIPAEAHGIKFMSMGFFAPGDQPLLWRGPMVHRALTQSLFDVLWGDLDYLFIDLPPGTGDAHLTLVQSVSVTGAVLVSTPQDVGLTISMKTYKMLEQANVAILGLVENMSSFVCSHCGQTENIFGHGGVAKAARDLKAPFLGEIPLDTRIREQADKGEPIILSHPESPSGIAYSSIVKNLAAQISIASFKAPKLQIVEEKV